VLADDGDKAQRALEEAEDLAAERGVAAAARPFRGGNVARGLLEASADAELLVVGARADAKAGDVALGSTASSAVHTAPLPVLLARPARDARAFPAAILAATDGSADSERAVELAGRIAMAHGSVITLIHVEDGQSSQPPAALARAAALLREDLGVETATTEEFRRPAEQLTEAARRERASLLIVGSRGLGRGPALGSVSERAAHEAPCSVLVVRNRA
jgi:nucleotide-binding universal stress UspA family protein